jgi:hypothetical protein
VQTVEVGNGLRFLEVVRVEDGQEAHNDARHGQNVEDGVEQLVEDAMLAAAVRTVCQQSCQLKLD